MNKPESEIILKPIGFVRNGITAESTRQNWENVISEIIIQPELNEALDNLDDFSHIIVLFWTLRNKKLSYKVHPKGSTNLPLVGLLATRSPDRPNPVAHTTVELLERGANILKVKGLDAFDGTPVIDIKPYLPGFDSVGEARVAEWAIERPARL